MKTRFGVNIQFRIAKDESGNDKFTRQEIVDKLLSGEAQIKKGGSCAFAILTSTNQIMGEIEDVIQFNYQENNSKLQKHINSLLKKIYTCEEHLSGQKQEIIRLNNFITKLMVEGRITKDDLNRFLDPKKPKPTRKQAICQCMYEIENDLKRTKFCRIPCTIQKEKNN